MEKNDKTRSMIEIEKKFLVKEIPENISQYDNVEIRQGYLIDSCEENNDIERRFRKENEKCFFTIKTVISGNGRHIREEKTHQITQESFNELWPKTEGRRLEKTRYKIPYGKYLIELDIYNGRHLGLVVAEIEFPNIAEAMGFIPPSWIGEDITEDKRYSNQELACYGLPQDQAHICVKK